MRSWIFLLGVLGIVATRCLGFTVDRSPRGIFISRNWTSPTLHIDRRPSVDKNFNGEIHPADIENILRASEMRDLIKSPDENYSPSSEDPSRGKRFEDVPDANDHKKIVEKIDLMLKESTIVSPSSESKPSGSTIVSIHKEMKTPRSTIASSPKELRNSGTTVLSVSQDTKASGSAIISSSSETETPQSTIAPKETKRSEIILNAKVVKKLEITSEKSLDKKKLKNVVFLLIDDVGTEKENASKLFEVAHKFSVQGILQNCHNSEVADMAKFPSGNSPVSRKVDGDCECDHLLRANIGSLLFWARHSKEMAISAVSTANFSIPLTLGYENPKTRFAREFEDIDEINGYHQEASRTKGEPNDMWHLIDIGNLTVDDNQSTVAASPSSRMGAISKQEGVNGFDGMWNVFDMFSKIRIAFFRILLESLGNMAGVEDESNGTRALSVQPRLAELVTDAIGELKSMPNDNGFVLVAAGPEYEFSAVVDLLQHEILTGDTLLVISGICSPTNEPVPFLAHGPGEKLISNARTIWELPELIKTVITDGCSDKSCKKQFPDESMSLPSLELSSLPQELLAKRIDKTAEKEKSVQ